VVNHPPPYAPARKLLAIENPAKASPWQGFLFGVFTVSMYRYFLDNQKIQINEKDRHEKAFCLAEMVVDGLCAFQWRVLGTTG
jgi:hypothetical protein